MARPALEIADIFRDHGSAWRQANAGHVSLGQLKVMSAIESCRTVALGGHVMRCEDCLHTQIAYNSCRNRHCPKCQGSQGARVIAPIRVAFRHRNDVGTQDEGTFAAQWLAYALPCRRFANTLAGICA